MTFFLRHAWSYLGAACPQYRAFRMAAFKKSTNNNAGQGVEKREHFYTVGRNAN